MEKVIENAAKTTVDCKALESVMPDLLFDPAAVPAAARAHLASCSICQAELAAVDRTVQLLDVWKLEETSPFWMARMEARFREEQQRPPRGFQGWLSTFRTRMWVSNHTMRPAGVAALGLLLAVCGGTWMDLALQPAPAAVQASNTVRDLQSLNENAQVFQALASLDGPDSASASTNN